VTAQRENSKGSPTTTRGGSRPCSSTASSATLTWARLKLRGFSETDAVRKLTRPR
jgi:hypothetical protein